MKKTKQVNKVAPKTESQSMNVDVEVKNSVNQSLRICVDGNRLILLSGAHEGETKEDKGVTLVPSEDWELVKEYPEIVEMLDSGELTVK